MSRLAQLAGEIEHLARGIPAPVSYLQGRIAPPASLPDNILCFVRTRADKLNFRGASSRVQHHRHLFIAASRGAGRVCVDDATHALREGQARLILPFQFHSYLSVRPAAICWIFLTFEMEDDRWLNHLGAAPSQALDEAGLFLLAEIVRQWKAGASATRLQLHLAALLARFSESKGRRMRPEPEHPVQDDLLLARVNRHVLTHLDRRLVLKQLAAAVGQSESHLRRRFRAATGLSLGRHLRELRLRQACSLLHRTPRPVGEIARACGFDSIYSFSRAFKSSLTVSPRTYRRNLRPA